MEWILPENTNKEDVKSYMVEFPSGNITSLNSYVTFAPHIHKCTSDIILRLRTVNRCDDVGDYSEDIQPELLDQATVMVASDTAALQGQCILQWTIISYIYH